MRTQASNVATARQRHTASRPARTLRTERVIDMTAQTDAAAANAASDASKLLAGVTVTTDKPAAKRAAPAKRTTRKPAAKTAPARVKEVHASSKNTPALVLTFAQAVRLALKSSATNADLVKIIDAQVKRSTRANKNSTPAQLARHAGIEARDDIIALAKSSKPARKPAASKS